MRRDVFQAIADPNRRAILALLATRKLTLNGVAAKFDISRPAVSRHVRILAECGLVRFEKEGRHRYCEARLGRLKPVSTWVEQYRMFWESKLVALEEHIEKTNSHGERKKP